MSLELFPFQKVGRDFLAGRRRALLADEMRLGKTRQALEAAAKVGARSVRVIGPAVSSMVWEEQHKEGGYTFSLEFLSYDAARNRHDERAWAQGVSPWTPADVLIVDEVHFCKNVEAKRTKAVLGRGGAAWYANYLWFLSGTPAPNHVGELWPVLRISGVVRAAYWDFVKHFCNVDSLGTVRGTNLARAPELRDILSGFMLRRRKAEVAPELPKVSLEPYPVESNPAYLQMVFPHDHEGRLRDWAKASEQLTEELSKLPPEEHAAYLESRGDHFATQRATTALLKAPAVADLIRFQIENELVDKLVVFGYHKHAMMCIREELRHSGIKADVIFGGTPPKKKEVAIKRFRRANKKGGTQVFIGQILAAGTAIDLSVAHTGIMLERDWVPGNNAQALERMGGFKQKLPISIADAVLPGSIDERVAAAVNRKTLELAEVFD